VSDRDPKAHDLERARRNAHTKGRNVRIESAGHGEVYSVAGEGEVGESRRNRWEMERAWDGGVSELPSQPIVDRKVCPFFVSELWKV
jgi:hypothetical protein